MIDPISTITTTNVAAPTNTIEEQQNNSKKGFTLWSLFPDFILPWSNTNPVESLSPVEKVNPVEPSKEQDQAVFYKSISEFLKEAQDFSNEANIPLKDVFLLLDQLQMKDQREIERETFQMTQKEFKKNTAEQRKIQKERIEKLLETLERAKKTKYWDSFKNAVAFLQIGLTTLEAGARSLTPAGMILSVLSLGEAIDSAFDDKGKRFLLELASKLLPQEQQKRFEDKSMQALKIGVAVSTIFLNFYSSEKLASWWSQFTNAHLRNPNVPGITIEEVTGNSWLRSINISQLRTDLWGERQKMWELFKNGLSSHLKFLTISTQTALRLIRSHHELQGNTEKADLLMKDQQQKENKSKIEGNLKALKGMVTQQQHMWENLRTIQAGRYHSIQMLTRF